MSRKSRAPYRHNSSNASSGVVSIQEDADRALWLGTDKLGLVKLTPDRKQAIWYQSDADDPENYIVKKEKTLLNPAMIRLRGGKLRASGLVPGG